MAFERLTTNGCRAGRGATVAWLLIATLLSAMGSFGTVPSAGAAFPGQAGKLAFDNSGDISVVNSDGTGRARLTQDGRSTHPVWSPDGSRIVFMKSSPGDPPASEIYVMQADGSNQVRLTSGAVDVQPTWSPDGARILFSRLTRLPDGTTVPDIMVMNADGSGVAVLAAHRGGGRLAWSPDGSKIAYAGSSGDFQGAPSAIFVMNADGSNPVQITTNETNNVYAFDPTWLPDGTGVTYAQAGTVGGHSRAGILVARLDGAGYGLSYPFGIGGTVDVTAYRYPAWAPDGRRIAYLETNLFTPFGGILVNGQAFTQDGDDHPDWQPIAPPPSAYDRSVTGTARLTSQGATRTFDVDARGGPRGQYTTGVMHYREDLPNGDYFEATGTVICLQVQENRASLTARITQRSGHLPANHSYWSVPYLGLYAEDNGSMAPGQPKDSANGFARFDASPPEAIAVQCPYQFEPAAVAAPLEQGDLTVVSPEGASLEGAVQQLGVQGTYDPLNPLAPAGVYAATFQFRNTSAQRFTDVHALITELTGGHVVVNRDGWPTSTPSGVGAVLSVRFADVLPGSPGVLEPGQTFTVRIEIGLQQRAPFRITFTGSGLPVREMTSTAATTTRATTAERVALFTGGGEFTPDAAPGGAPPSPTPTVTPPRPSPPVTPSPGPTACAPRPKIEVRTAQTAPGQIEATITTEATAGAPTNALKAVRLTGLTNARVQVAGGAALAEGATFTPPAGRREVRLLVTREQPGGMTAHLEIEDACGRHPTFVGAGAGVR